MRKQSTFLIFLLLLNSLQLSAQEEVTEDELKKVLDEGESKPSTEVSELSTEGDTVPIEAAPTTDEDDLLQELNTDSSQVSPDAAPTASPSENISSETVDIEGLDQLEDVKDEKTDIASGKASEPERLTEEDDLEALKTDLGEEAPKTTVPMAPEEKTETVKADTPTEAPTINLDQPAIFDVGKEEHELLSVAQSIQGQISDGEWNEVATAAKVDAYTVVKDDWLFKISKKLFGTGFYYPKIWSLNSYITNPHFIEPGMILSFTTGSTSAAPEVKLGSFTEDELAAAPGSLGNTNATDLTNFGEGVTPDWIQEKGKLERDGVYFQYASEETMDDLIKAGEQALNREYEHYDPPRSEFDIVIPKNYDKSGFDKNSKVFFTFKEGFYLSTFISTNIVQDFGSVVNGPDENIFFATGDHAYIKLDESVNALPGDRFSVYSSGGKVKHKNSDREGYKYTIVGQIKLLRKIRDKWEVEFIKVAGTPQRGDRVTAYTPQIERITRTYNSRLIEAGILATYEPGQNILGFGDVVYLDRGRADGVEMGNIFEVFGFKDRLTTRNITDQPTYKTGELTVITLTDNFATAVVSGSNRDFYAGDIAITKTKDSWLREKRAREAKGKTESTTIGGKALEELDVELNLENLNDDLLKQADKIQLTEDELAELERQEREKSVIKDSEKDLKSLERLESEIEQAESILNDAKLDEDKLLEGENLNDLEKKRGNVDQDSLDEIEENLGKRYIDEDLNSKDNPFGLTEFDVEEVDELLNIEKKENK